MPQGQTASSSSDFEQASKPHRPRKTARDYDPDLEWFIACGESVLGARGTLAGVIGQCERGSVGGSGTLDRAGSYIHPFTDQQLGFGRAVTGEVEKHRWLSTVWHALSAKTRDVLLARYTPLPAEFRSDEGYGAKDKFIKDTDPYGPPPPRETGKRGQPVRVKQYEARLARWESERDRVRGTARTTGVEAHLAEYAGLALRLANSPAALLLACHEPDPQKTRLGLIVVNRSLQAKRHKAIADAIKHAEAASLEAHREWFESKSGADPMRKDRERVRRSG